MMVYTPAPPATFIPGYSGAGAYWPILLIGVDDAYTDFGPPHICSVIDAQVDVVTDVLVAEWIIPGNADNVDVTCYIRWRGTTGYTATATFVVTDGVGSDSATATRTTTTYGTSAITVTPTSSSGHPRYGQLWLRISTAGQLAQVNHVLSRFTPTIMAAGPLASGAAKVASWGFSDGAYPSEVVARAANNLRAIARDRPACLAGGLGAADAVGPFPPAGPSYGVTSSTFEIVDRWIQPFSEVARRPYRLALKLGGTDPEAKLTIGGWSFTATGTGWHFDLPTLALAEGMYGSLYLRSTSGGTCQVNTWQLLREP